MYQSCHYLPWPFYVLSPLEQGTEQCPCSGPLWWVPLRKCRVVTQAESELQGEHIAIALENLAVSCPQHRDTKSFPGQLPGGSCGDGVCKWESPGRKVITYLPLLTNCYLVTSCGVFLQGKLWSSSAARDTSTPRWMMITTSQRMLSKVPSICL